MTLKPLPQGTFLTTTQLRLADGAALAEEIEAPEGTNEFHHKFPTSYFVRLQQVRWTWSNKAINESREWEVAIFGNEIHYFNGRMVGSDTTGRGLTFNMLASATPGPVNTVGHFVTMSIPNIIVPAPAELVLSPLNPKTGDAWGAVTLVYELLLAVPPNESLEREGYEPRNGQNPREVGGAAYGYTQRPR